MKVSGTKNVSSSGLRKRREFQPVERRDERSGGLGGGGGKKNTTRIIGGRFGGKRGEIGREILGSITESVRVAACELHGRAQENKEEKGSYEFVSDFGYHVTRRLPDVSFPPRVPAAFPAEPNSCFLFAFLNRTFLFSTEFFFRG